MQAEQTKVSPETLASISMPDQVETPTGKLDFFDGVPSDETINKLYDAQTRSLLQTGQAFPPLGSQSEGLQKNADGSFDLYFAPEPPAGKEGNWLQTLPGKSWFAILRMYGPLEPWINKTWRPGEIDPMN